MPRLVQCDMCNKIMSWEQVHQPEWDTVSITHRADYYLCEDCIDKLEKYINDASRGMNIVYICDKKACKTCNPGCEHTRDIKHAKNFIRVSKNKWAEKVEKVGN